MNKTHFDIKYLRKYVHGELSASEMHKIEIAAHEDEMLMDIISGLEYELENELSTPKEELRDNINQRSSKTIIIPKKRFSFKILNIAASLFLIAGIGAMYFYSKNNVDNTVEFASTDEVAFVDSAQSPPLDTLFDSNHENLIAQHAPEQGKIVNFSTEDNATIIKAEKETSLAPTLDNISGTKNIELNQTISAGNQLQQNQEEVIIAQNINKEKTLSQSNNQQILLAEANVSAPKTGSTQTAAQQRAKLNTMNLDPQTQKVLNDVLQRQALEESRTKDHLFYKNVTLDSANSYAHSGQKALEKSSQTKQIGEKEDLYETVIITSNSKTIQKNSEPDKGLKNYKKKLIKEITKSIPDSFYFKVQFKLGSGNIPDDIQFLESSNPQFNPILEKLLISAEKWKAGEDREKVILELKGTLPK